MQRFILARFFQAILCVFVVSLVVFVISRLSGNPVDVFLSDSSTMADRTRLIASLGLDKPLPEQYWIFLTKIIHLDFGTSIMTNRPAIDLVLERIPATLQLGGMAIIGCVAIALPVGIYSAANRGKWFDALGRGVAVMGQAMPQFWLGIMLIYTFSVGLHLLPPGGRGGIENIIMPAFTLSWYVSAGIMRLARSSMLDVMGSEYIKLAKLKGLPDSIVVWKHGFKNAALPVLTFAVLTFVGLIHGSVVTETVFAWPGVGRLAINSIKNQDYAVVQTVVMMFSVMYITGNLIVDILYGYLNPKIRFQK